MLDDIVKERRKKLDAIREKGLDPYPARVKRDNSVAETLEDFEKLEKSAKSVSVAGRVRSLRDQGAIAFADIEDGTGKIQAVIKEDSLKDFAFWQSVLDLGDFIS